MNIIIGVATHKKYWMPNDNVYLPIQAGSAEKNSLGYQRDDTGDNISNKNLNYCELTVLYWIWKNVKADYAGLVHYRRYFTNREIWLRGEKKHQILNGEAWKQLVQKYPIIIPNKRNYYIENNYSHYIHAHHKEGLDIAAAVITEKYPDYALAVDKVWKRRWAHMFNMFVMRRDFFDSYCQWLFDVLNEVEMRLDISQWNSSEARVYGYISELLLDVWLEANQLDYKEQNVSFMESQNWIKKGGSFLWRKLTR